MKKSLSSWQYTGFIFTAIAGILLHFAYNWSNQSPLLAPFAAVNESIWEHMKLLFFPMFVFALIENHFWGSEYDNFWCVKLIGITLGLLLIPTLYYTYTGAFGIMLDFINITIFFLTTAIVYSVETRIFESGHTCRISSRTAFIILCLIAFIFVVFTFFPPQIPLFEAPKTGRP